MTKLIKTIGQVAESYAIRGWLLFPLHSVRDSCCTCGQPGCSQPGRHPLVPDGLLEASCKSLQVARWWRATPAANIGLATGSHAGLWALTLTTPAARDALVACEERLGRLPRSPCASFGVCGLQYLFRYFDDRFIETATEHANFPFAVEAEGGFALLPPSRHVSGGDFAWLVTPTQKEPAEAPGWLLDMVLTRCLPPGVTTIGLSPNGPSCNDVGEPCQQITVGPADTHRVGAPGEPVDQSPVLSPSAMTPAPSSAPDLHDNSQAVRSADSVPRIDPEFAQHILPLSTEELAQLETNLLLARRCRDPLVVWKGHDLLLDGHHRLPLCQRHHLPFSVEAIDLLDREAALDWIIDNQLGRRNLTPETTAYLRGKKYEVRKRAQGGTGANQHGSPDEAIQEQSGKSYHSAKTEAQVAAEYKVSPRTIRNDAQFTRAVDTIAGNCGEEARKQLLSKDSKLTRKAVQELAQLTPKQQRRAMKDLVEGRSPPRSARPATSPTPREHPAPPAPSVADDKVDTTAAPSGIAASAVDSLTIVKPIEDPKDLATRLEEFLGAEVCATVARAWQQPKKAPATPEQPTPSADQRVVNDYQCSRPQVAIYANLDFT